MKGVVDIVSFAASTQDERRLVFNAAESALRVEMTPYADENARAIRYFAVEFKDDVECGIDADFEFEQHSEHFCVITFHFPKNTHLTLTLRVLEQDADFAKNACYPYFCGACGHT